MGEVQQVHPDFLADKPPLLLLKLLDKALPNQGPIFPKGIPYTSNDLLQDQISWNESLNFYPFLKPLPKLLLVLHQSNCNNFPQFLSQIKAMGQELLIAITKGLVRPWSWESCFCWNNRFRSIGHGKKGLTRRSSRRRAVGPHNMRQLVHPLSLCFFQSLLQTIHNNFICGMYLPITLGI